LNGQRPWRFGANATERRGAASPTGVIAVTEGMERLLVDRRGTAAIEFGLIAPLMVLLILGLADGVRTRLAEMDVDAAASSGARTAITHGFDVARIEAAMAAPDAMIEPSIRLVKCDKSQSIAFCAKLPPGRYVAIEAQSALTSLFGALQPSAVVAAATVRLP
jgi:Flp pilus assembly protein TadG